MRCRKEIMLHARDVEHRVESLTHISPKITTKMRLGVGIVKSCSYCINMPKGFFNFMIFEQTLQMVFGLMQTKEKMDLVFLEYLSVVNHNHCEEWEYPANYPKNTSIDIHNIHDT